MTISKKVLNVMLVLVLLSGIGSVIYFARENDLRASALEENIEYRVLTAIEAQHPEIYVVAVKMMNEHVLVYYTLSDTDQDEAYFKQLAVDLAISLFDGYPDAATYHLLATRIIDIETFAGDTHVGIADRALSFTHLAVNTLASSDSSAVDLLDLLLEEGQIEFYLARTFGRHVIAEPTLRERGHIPPWAEVED